MAGRVDVTRGGNQVGSRCQADAICRLIYVCVSSIFVIGYMTILYNNGLILGCRNGARLGCREIPTKRCEDWILFVTVGSYTSPLWYQVMPTKPGQDQPGPGRWGETGL